MFHTFVLKSRLFRPFVFVSKNLNHSVPKCFEFFDHTLQTKYSCILFLFFFPLPAQHKQNGFLFLDLILTQTSSTYKRSILRILYVKSKIFLLPFPFKNYQEFSLCSRLIAKWRRAMNAIRPALLKSLCVSSYVCSGLDSDWTGCPRYQRCHPLVSLLVPTGRDTHQITVVVRG